MQSENAFFELPNRAIFQNMMWFRIVIKYDYFKADCVTPFVQLPCIIWAFPNQSYPAVRFKLQIHRLYDILTLILYMYFTTRALFWNRQLLRLSDSLIAQTCIPFFLKCQLLQITDLFFLRTPKSPQTLRSPVSGLLDQIIRDPSSEQFSKEDKLYVRKLDL